MPRPSIDYMNARRGISRGTIPADRLRNATDDKAAFAGLDYHEQVMLQVDHMIRDFAAWSRNLAPLGTAAEDWEF